MDLSHELKGHEGMIYAQSKSSIYALPHETHTNGLVPGSRKRPSSAAFTVAIPPRFAPLPYSTSRTGIVYDDRMRFHVDSDPTQDHPEQPRRILKIYTELNEAELIAKPDSSDTKAEFQLLPIEIRAATDEEILLVHSQAHLDFVQELAGTFATSPHMTKLTYPRQIRASIETFGISL